MKKTLLALAVLTAGSANAGINLYDANGVKADLSGAVEIQYHKGFDKAADGDVRLDDGDLALNTSVVISDQLSVVTGTAFKYEKGNVENDELWAGFSGDFGTLTFGRQVNIYDDTGIGMDFEGAIDLDQDDVALKGTTDGDNVVKYVYDNGSFYAGLSHKLDNAKGDNNGVTDGRLGFRTAGLDARVYYIDDAGKDLQTWNVEAEYAVNNLVLAASYADSEKKSGDNDGSHWAVAGSYTLDKTTFALGYNNVADNDNDFDNVYANVTQKLHSNVKVYGELAWLDEANADYDVSYTAGLEVKF